MADQVEKKIDPVLDGIEWSIVHFAGGKTRDKVFGGKTLGEISEKYAEDPVGKAMWVKGAMERLEALANEDTRCQLMEYCGGMCAGVAGRPWIEEAKERRKKYDTLDEFMKAEGFEGDVLYVTYTFEDGKRCHCVGNGLPAGETMSRTYCHCGAGHVKASWEEVLEMPVKVELIHSAISGADECKFAVHLVEKEPKDFKCQICGAAFKTAKEQDEHIALARAQGYSV